MSEKRATFDEMTNWALQEILSAFGKGRDLESAVFQIVNSSANWGAENVKESQRKKDIKWPHWWS